MKNSIKTSMITFLVAIATFAPSQFFAQDFDYEHEHDEKRHERHEKHEKIKEMKVAFINKEVEFTDDEAKTFWAIHDKYHQKHMELNKEKRTFKEKFKGKDIDDLSETELMEILNFEMNYKEKILALKKAEQNELIKVIPLNKIVKYHHAEHKFRKHLRKKAEQFKHN